MKKASFFLALLLTLALCACGGAPSTAPVDVDLTALSSTMVYAEVYNMVSNPQDYVGKRVLMRGTLDVYEGEAATYFSCVVADATACCAQGLEFVLQDGYSYPDDYPAAGEEITVEGTFSISQEGQYYYIQIVDAVLLDR